MCNVLMTGCNGFIGKYLASSELIHRHVIRQQCVNSYRDSFKIEQLHLGTNWSGAFENIDCVIHLAGLAHSLKFSKQDYVSVNVEGTLKLASEAAKADVKRFVFVSSIGVNGISTKQRPFSIHSEPLPHNTYAKSKLAAEEGLRKIAKETGLEIVIVRPTLVYGENAPGNFGTLVRLVQKVPFLPFGLVNNKRDFIAVQNLVDLLITCAKHPDAAGHTFLASDGRSVSTKEFTNAIAKGFNKSLIQLPIPTGLMQIGARMIGKKIMAEQLLGNLQVDSSNTKHVLGWVPPYTMEQAMSLLKENKK